MKITVDIDCTPEEARRFFGMPDLQPIQEAVLKAMQERLIGNIQAMDPETIWKTWMGLGAGMGAQGLDQLRNYWAQFGAGAKEGPKKSG